MDDTLKVEFVLGDRYIVVRQPSEGQVLALSLTRPPEDGDTGGALTVTQRVARVLENLIDPVAWERDVFGQLLDERVTGRQFLDFALSVVRYDWAGARAHLEAPTPAPEPEPVTPPAWALSEREQAVLNERDRLLIQQAEKQSGTPRVVRGDS